jgi:hypothetical protein
MDARPVSFLAFFLMWARMQGWVVPRLHVRICHWLETCTEPERVLMIFRGAAKSTIYAVYKAWKLYRDRNRRSLVWSADNETAGMLTADTINVLRNHPLCRGMLPTKPGAKRFWVTGARDARNASMRAVGVSSNATGARADDVDFDDIEVPGNIETAEARKKLRQRISESTHIAVPGAQKTYIGTPHTHDSIYPERIAGGAAVLKIPLFEHHDRYSADKASSLTRFPFSFTPAADGLYVFVGIGKPARLLQEGRDYLVEGRAVVFAKPPGQLLDIYAGCAWPERFTREEVERRRRETPTLNAWDSQYGLEAKPLTDIRLDPARVVPYACEPTLQMSNRVLSMWLGAAKIESCSLRWDPSSGKLNSDVSAVVLDLQDAIGRHYWHRVVGLTGEIAETSKDGKTIIGGQVMQLCDIVEQFQVPRVVLESNGIGGFAASFLRMALKQRRLACGITEVQAVTNKNKRILEALEPLIGSGMLWAHVDVLEGPLWDQMKGWNPGVTDQADDLLDAGAGAVTDQPVKVGKLVRNVDPSRADHWHSAGGVYEVSLED